MDRKKMDLEKIPRDLIYLINNYNPEVVFSFDIHFILKLDWSRLLRESL